MLKFLRSFALTAVMLLPFAAQAQETLTVADGTATNNFVPIYGNYIDDPIGTQSIYPAEMLSELVGTSITHLHWYISSGSSSNWGSAKPITVKFTIVDETSFSSSWLSVASGTTVYDGTITTTDVTADGYTIELDDPYVYTGGNLMISIQANPNDLGGYGQTYWFGINQNVTNASRYGYSINSYNFASGGTNQSFLPKLTFTYVTLGGCMLVHDLAVSNLTHNSLTLTWADTNNTGATYTVLNGEDVVAANVTGNSYNVTGLQAYTDYTFSVIANCSDGEMSAARRLSVRTLCGPVQLPYSTSFENNELGDVYPSSYNLPACWSRYNDGTNSSYSIYPYSYNSYGYTGSRCLYLSLNFTSGYGDTILAIMPQVDVTNFPMNNNQVRFMGRTYNPSMMLYVEVGTLTDPTDHSTFVADDTVLVNTSNVYAEFEAKLGTHSTGSWPAFRFIKDPTLTITAYIDDVNIEVQPTCFVPRNVALTDVSSTSATLTWTDTVNTGATYSIQRTSATDTAWFTAAAGDTAYTFTGLTPNTNYTVTIRTVCSATDSSRAITVSTRTLRDEHNVTSFSASGTTKRGDVVIDSTTFAVTIPVWYSDNLNSLYLSWTLSTSAAAFIDTAADGSYTCQVTTTSIKNYLRYNIPMTVRVKAEDRALYTDFTITLVSEECVADRNLQFDRQRIRYTATWDNPDTAVTEHWFINSPVRLDATALAAAQHITVSNAHQYTVEDLARETKYYVYLKSACDTTWIEDSLTTRAVAECHDVVLANGTSTNGYVPLYGNYAERHQRIQSIYPASMLEDYVGATIESLQYYVSSGSSANWGSQTWEVSLGVTDQANLSSGYVDTLLLTRVYTGTLSASVANGMTITFDQPFTYTGQNLVVQFVQRVPNSYTNCNFYGINSYSEVSNASRYSYPANTADLFADNGSTASFLPKVSFSYCTPADPCPEVTAIALDSISNTIANISWTAADADYCVGNQIIVSPTMLDETVLESATPVALAANAVSYDATGLTPDHDYYVYIRALCNGSEHPEGMSGWATAEFHTFPTVRTPEIANAQFVGKHEVSLDVVNTGAAIGQPDNFSYLVSTTLLDATALANATPTANGIDTSIISIDNLASATKYFFYVRNAMGNEVSPWSEPDSVTMPVATPAVVGLNVTNVAHNAMTAYWMRDVANYADETAWKTAIVLHGQQPAASDWTIVTDTLAENVSFNVYLNLLTDTAYDIYVMPYFAATQTTGDTARLDSVRTATFPSNCVTMGEGTSSSSFFFPGYYGWHYSAGLYPATRSGLIEAIAAQAYNARAVKNDSMRVWVKVVDANFAFDVNTTTFNGMLDGATEIFAGDSIDVANNEWKSFQFPTPVSINEGEQLLVLVRAKSQATSGDGQRSVYATSVSGKFWYIAKDNSDIDPATATVSSPQSGSGSIYGTRPNLQLCYAMTTTCLDVATVMNNHLTDTTIDLMWYPGNEESTWQFAYSTSDSLTATELEAAAQTLTTPNIHLSSLVHDTNYTVYIRPVCSDSETGNWTRRSFTTPHVDFYDAIVTVNDSAMGTASSALEVREGTVATLVAEANEGFELYKWTYGDSTAYGDTLTLTMDSNVAVNAYFRYSNATIAASEVTFWSGNGENQAVVAVNWADTALAWGVNFSTSTITVQDAMDTIAANDPRFSYVMAGGYLTDILFVENGDTLRGTSYWESTNNGMMDLGTAQPLANGDFEKWGDPAAGAVYDSTYYEGWGWNFLYTYPMAIQAVTAPVFYTVSVSYDTTMGTVTGAPEAPVFIGTEVTLTATPADGYHFNGWSNGATDSVITFVVVSDTTLTANFEADTRYFTLTVNYDDAMGSVTGVPTEAVAEGTVVTLTAVANSGYRFAGWSNGETTAEISVTVNSDTTLTATFEVEEVFYTVTVVYDQTMGMVTGDGQFRSGSIATLEAIALPGYRFVGWSNGSTDAHIEFTVVSDTTFEATFEQEVGISDVEGADAIIRAAEGRIVVMGVENLSVNVFDVNGRSVRSEAKATETMEIAVPSTGVYIVKVGNAPAKRVVVVR